MNKNLQREKIVNSEEEKKMVNSKEEHGIAQIDAKISTAEAEKKREKNKKSKLTMDDLKGKKADGDPELESDQPLNQDY